MKLRLCLHPIWRSRKSDWRCIEHDLHSQRFNPVMNIRESRTAVAGAPAEQPLRPDYSWIFAGVSRAVLLAIASLLIAFLTWQFLSTFLFNPFLIPPPL